MKRAAFFDIDGVLYDGSLLFDFTKKITGQKLFKKEYFDKIFAFLEDYSNGKTTYESVVRHLPEYYASGIEGQVVNAIEKEARDFINKVEFFPYASELVKLMKEYTDMSIAISGASIELLIPLGEIFNFDIVHGTEILSERGVYTNILKKNMAVRETKQKLVFDIVKENGIDLKNSYAFGDTEQDIAFMESVGNPIAINPNPNLRNISKERHWLQVSKEQNVIKHIKKILNSK